MSPALKYSVDPHGIDQRAVPNGGYARVHDANLARSGPSSISRPRSSQKRAIASSQRRSPVRKLPTSQTAPRWLTLLIVAQRSSTAIVTLLVIAVFGVYGWTVFSQQVWGQQYQRKVELEKDRRDYTTANGALKAQSGQMAESADSGLALPGPNTNVQISIMPLRPHKPAEAPAQSISELTGNDPVGY